MEEDRTKNGPLTEVNKRNDDAGWISLTSRSLLCAIWGIFFLFIAFNPLGLFMMLYVLIVPAWIIGCTGLFFGIRALVKRQGAKSVAVIGIALNSIIVLSPLYPFVVE